MKPICESILADISHETVTLSFPSDLTGIWTSQSCEVRPGPEFLIRKYSFDKRNFTVEQFYYKDSQCSTPLYAIVAKGRIKAQRWSLLTQGGVESRYHLHSVSVLPYSPSAAWSLKHRSFRACPHLSKSHWKPFYQYNLMKLLEHSILDCTDKFSWTLNEFQLLKLEKRIVYKGFKLFTDEELFTGDIHLDNTVRKHFYRPTDYQTALKKPSGRACKICHQISNSDLYHPPILPKSPFTPISTIGHWVSVRCETRPLGMFITRRLTFYEGGNNWSGTYNYFRDPRCRQPSFTLDAEGKYSEIMGTTTVIGGTKHYKFTVQRLKITPEHYSISENLNFYNGSGCGVPGSWRIGITQDVTSTHGCRPMDIRLPNVVLETIKTVTDVNKERYLYMGKRVMYSGPRSHSYPTSFQPPLQSCTKGNIKRKSGSSSLTVRHIKQNIAQAKPLIQLSGTRSLYATSMAARQKTVNSLLITSMMAVVALLTKSREMSSTRDYWQMLITMCFICALSLTGFIAAAVQN
ncbi:protein APCDD1 [Octopus bimaculoides]|uniref:protein APCDD1 n=1 Tax=Octopus bimaculoides TaxID=37653 RepID=UPI0022E17C1B|nr:protein APCDD1 [Octopus bimaculoides]